MAFIELQSPHIVDTNFKKSNKIPADGRHNLNTQESLNNKYICDPLTYRLLAVLFDIITVHGKIYHKINFSICAYFVGRVAQSVKRLS